MRLKSIKLWGFKSFVDATQLQLLGNRTAIVGPNGCGKSNIVDAIHCVLGSTSKNLRADLMSDVIFNGTTTRKPVGQASIELAFDNSSGRIGGEYAQYPEISVRRELNRDGQSNYYINGTSCRRRDITDIFLGTGLGQNSYAIIGQGTIARLIEAKPEELRNHVEEAAGTSKYKERRRETENRIKHTRENLDRLNDLREEQIKQLSHLQRQANAAERFKTLKQEHRLLKAQLQAILWQSLSEQIGSYDSQIKTQETLLEAKLAELTHIDAEVESQRSIRIELNDKYSDIQSGYYGLGADITGLEQRITHSKERIRQLENDAQQLETSYQELTTQNAEDQQQIEERSEEVIQVELNFEQFKDQAETLQESLSNAQQAMHQWQEQWDAFNTASAQTSKQIEVEKTKIHHLEQKQQSLLQRIARIRDEETQQNSEELLQEVLVFKEQQSLCQARLEELQATLDGLHDKITSQRVAYQEAQQQVTILTKELRDQQAKYASLEALQRIALGKSDTEITGWLQNHALEKRPRLAEGLTVESGWEVAVETALESHLDAIGLDDFNDIREAIVSLQNADVTFFNINSAQSNAETNAKLIPLKSKLSTQWPALNLLQHVYCVEDLNEALQAYPLLQSHESIMTRDGIWLSSSWLKIARQVTQKSGVLQREQDIKEVQRIISDKQNILDNHERDCLRMQDQLNFYTEEREAMQHQYQSLKAKNSDYLAQIRAKENYAAQLQLKQASLMEEMQESDKQLVEVEQSLEESRTHLAQISELVLDEKSQREQLLNSKEQFRVELDQVREQTAYYKQNASEAQLRLESIRNQVQFLTQNISRTQRQLATIEERRIQLKESLAEMQSPLPELTQELQQTLAKRALIESDLKEAKAQLDNVDNAIAVHEKNRHSFEKEHANLRNSLEEMRLSCQSIKVRHATHFEQVQEAGFTLETLLQELPENYDAASWEESIIKIDTRIQRLGPINLAAIEEYSQLLERKEYIDKQNDDLVEALTTLEDAIKKIDRETRARFKETFNLLNENFKIYFNQIFGGGEASLELTSDDLLESGVIVRAQPPGKKNTTIHLLSGGEKALTAIALVFAIFNLNPAPFCVLDEVDAPLDDANVVRFCNLVKKMSEKIQFIFISHNKITIEMGQQLAGVTMHEPGVSRLVSVDIDEAINLATA
jgi:chromosome segregation protein